MDTQTLARSRPQSAEMKSRPITRCFLMATTIAALTFSSPLTAIADNPDGRFCGKLLSGGSYTDVETSLTEGLDGRLSGSYVFREQNTLVEGTLTEVGGGSDRLGRAFRWRDNTGPADWL